MDRAKNEALLRELHAARIDGHLDRLCALFAADAQFRIAGTGDGKPIAISARGIAQVRPWLAMLLKAFTLSRYEVLSVVIDGAAGAIHWRADIHSKVTGAAVRTELMDFVYVQNGRIASYTEFFVPC